MDACKKVELRTSAMSNMQGMEPPPPDLVGGDRCDI